MDCLSLEEIQLRAHQRILGLTIESQDIRVNTNTILNEKGVKINPIEEDMGQISRDMREAEKTLAELNKCCGLCVCPCNRIKSFDAGKAYKPGHVTSHQLQQATTGTINGRYIKHINLTQVSNILEGKKKKAFDLDNEIKKRLATNKDHINILSVRTKKLIDSRIYYTLSFTHFPSSTFKSLPFQSLKFWFYTLLIGR
ncbi:unnamed protein product [Nyctereutes procyonoides]|uniref:(raccoon dog) hypothetical protein n=1 Tax=Nyctereutes procyonoides TaxID=34880 RepID=A0A811YW94_NYCPR|nr:unnamed protein product [Nyctereutes procyonoides]